MPGQYPENPKAKMWLWVCVGIVSAIILVLWGWATSISLSSFSWEKTPEKKLMEKSQNDWDTLFNNEQARIKNERMKSQIKNILNTIITEVNTTTSATSTINVNTTNSSTLTTSSQNT